MLKRLFLTTLATLLSCAFILGNPIDSTKFNGLDRAQKINALYDSIAASNRYVEKLDTATFFNLPVGFKGGAGNGDGYSLLINSAVVKPDGANFTACMSLTNPIDGSRLAFEAQNIPFSFKGGLKGDIRLVLVSEQRFKICKDVDLRILPGTYVEWDCNGFKRLKIKGEVDFSSKTFLAANEKGELLDSAKRLTAYIETEVKNLNDLALTFSISPFQIKGVPDITFSCTNLVIDYSDYTNPEAIKFPNNYLSSYPSGNETLWRGIYLGKASVILGPKFQKKNTKTPTTFSASDLIIDEKGFTGKLSATNILPLNEGDLGGWEFSINTLSAEFLSSKLTSASFGGEVHVPVFKDSSNLSYSAIIDMEGKYSFTVSPSDSLEFSVLGSSKLVLYKNSFVNITVENGKFVPTALLTGNLTINAALSKGNDKNNFKLAKVDFQEMRVSTVEPVFDVKYIAVSGLSQGAFAAFPISIDKIAFRTTPTTARLSVDLVVNLVPSKDEGFGGKTTLTLVADREGFKFKYKGIEIEKIHIDIVKKNAFEIHGGIAFAKDDPVYGNGFRGDLKAKFGKNIEIEAVALFGKIKDTRYFFVDGLFAMKPGIQAGPLTFYGFGGGLYYHMKQRQGVVDANSFGASRSGLVYAPNDSISIGIMAEVKFGVVSDKIIDADVKFEIVFNSSGGLNRIAFTGIGKCIVPDVDIVPEKIKAAAQKLAGGDKLDLKPTDAAIAVSVFMQMDFENDVFHAELEAFVNVGPILTGVGPNGSAGKCVMHIEPKKWYLHIGTPTNPIGLKLLGMFQTSSYFMVGCDIPTGLPMNPTVASILNITPDKACAGRDNAKLDSGKGIAFGSSFSLNTGDLTFLIFYAKFEFGAGFDILMLNYDKDTYCEGHSAPLGINGWYAKGQAYAYLNGNIGLKVKVFRKEKKFEILSIAAALLFQAEGPNPLYLEGQAGGHFSVLGGLVKGECKFKVTCGEKCNMVKPNKVSPVQDLEMIAAVTPAEKATDVDLFTIPQAVFNVPVNKVMNISDDNGTSHLFRANLERCEFKQAGQPVVGVSEWNADNTVLVFKTSEMLSANADYSFDVEVSFDEWKNDTWQTLTDNGAKITEKKSCNFKTGALPKEIPIDKVSYSYPVMRQYNFYPQEYGEGYIAFNIGVTPFFSLGSDWSQKARFVPINGGTPLLSDLVYNSSTRTVKFAIPSNLNLGSIYRLELTNIPTTSDISRNVTQKVTDTNLNDSLNSMKVTTKEATGSISKAEEIVFLKYGLRTSKYKTFTEKLNITELKVRALYEVSPYVYHLQATYYSDEMFDKYEIFGENTPPLVRRTAVLENTPWFKNYAEPIIYKDYPLLGQPSIVWRNPSELGVPPTGDIKIWQLNFDHVLTDEELESGVATAVTTWAHFMYALPYNWCKDYYDIRMKLANLYPSMTHSDPHINSILNKVIWPVVSDGAYPVKFEYVLPGINQVTSSKTFTINNPFNIVQPSL